MITINDEIKGVTVTNSTGDIVKIDGSEFQLTSGSIELVNLPSYYDIQVYKLVEENHIERPIVPEPEIIIDEPVE